ncbi:ABC transporter permease [Pedobacter sp. Hv1]|uniref:ABC transporter permease n=1 Tax=Pedobacter sp. Hv1 TaxID=1740090 RepID=UPI0006D896B4|nr:ABC transporter permease [Pedobacter sp. Hv1]KQC01678.1 hypothetical protein AQF98_04710 [Pedobacter sp. Hv1]
MFKLNLKIVLRNIWRHKLTTAIKLVGLIIGLSTVVVLIAYVMFELSFDRYAQNAMQIYRLQSIEAKSQKENIQLPSGLAEMLLREIPEIEKTTNLFTYNEQIKVGNTLFKRELLTTDPVFFEMFSIPLIAGDLKSVLKQPNTIVVSATFAKTAFPKGNALGQSILLENDKKPFQVVGIMKDVPKASHFNADLVIKSDLKKELNWRAYSSVPQYIQIKKGTSVEFVQQKLKSLYKKYQFPEGVSIKLMPLTKIHLYSHTTRELAANGDIKYVYIFSIVAFFILLIAIVNFINLTVAASLKRGKEIGIKKVMGASVGQLRIQFLSESYLYFLLATVLVLILTYDLIPVIGSKIGIAISLADMVNVKTIWISIGVIIISGFVAGLYPAIILSKLMPVKTLKGYTGHTSGRFGFKKILMVFQFSISAFLIVCTLIIYAQLKFIKTKNLGFDKNQLMVSSYRRFGNNFTAFKAELLQNKEIKSVSLSSFDPGKTFGGSSSWTNDNDTTNYTADFIDADFDFIKTLDIKTLKGRVFSEKYGSDVFDYYKAAENLSGEEARKLTDQKPILLNEAAVKAFNLKRPIDTILSYGGLQGKVIGVVSNFNGMSLHTEVKPVAIQVSLNPTSGYLYIKTNTEDLVATKAKIEEIWKKHFPEILPDLQFMDEHLQQLYMAELRLGSIFISFAAIAIFLCCIGLFGMVYFDLEQRTKEIAVRKILGASVKDLLTLLNSGFMKAVLLANLIIWPIAYYLTKEWLNSFYYRIEISYVPFVAALMLCIILTLLTVSLQAIRTVKKSPVDALKYE